MVVAQVCGTVNIRCTLQCSAADSLIVLTPVDGREVHSSYISIPSWITLFDNRDDVRWSLQISVLRLAMDILSTYPTHRNLLHITLQNTKSMFELHGYSLRNNRSMYVPVAESKAVPVQSWTGPEGSRRLRLPDFKTINAESGNIVIPTHRPPLPPRKYSWYTFLLGTESTPGP